MCIGFLARFLHCGDGCGENEEIEFPLSLFRYLKNPLLSSRETFGSLNHRRRRGNDGEGHLWTIMSVFGPDGACCCLLPVDLSRGT